MALSLILGITLGHGVVGIAWAMCLDWVIRGMIFTCAFLMESVSIDLKGVSNVNILVIESSPHKRGSSNLFKDQGMILGTGCGSVSMTKRSGFPQKAYEFGKKV